MSGLTQIMGDSFRRGLNSEVVTFATVQKLQMYSSLHYLYEWLVGSYSSIQTQLSGKTL